MWLNQKSNIGMSMLKQWNRQCQQQQCNFFADNHTNDAKTPFWLSVRWAIYVLSQFFFLLLPSCFFLLLSLSTKFAIDAYFFLLCDMIIESRPVSSCVLRVCLIEMEYSSNYNDSIQNANANVIINYIYTLFWLVTPKTTITWISMHSPIDPQRTELSTRWIVRVYLIFIRHFIGARSLLWIVLFAFTFFFHRIWHLTSVVIIFFLLFFLLFIFSASWIS